MIKLVFEERPLLKRAFETHTNQVQNSFWNHFVFVIQGFWETSLIASWKYFHAPKFCRAFKCYFGKHFLTTVFETKDNFGSSFDFEKISFCKMGKQLEIVFIWKQSPFWRHFFNFWENQKLLSICKAFQRSFEK